MGRLGGAGEIYGSKAREFPNIRGVGSGLAVEQLREYFTQQIWPSGGQQSGTTTNVPCGIFNRDVYGVGAVKLVDFDIVLRGQLPAKGVDKNFVTIMRELLELVGGKIALSFAVEIHAY